MRVQWPRLCDPSPEKEGNVIFLLPPPPSFKQMCCLFKLKEIMKLYTRTRSCAHKRRVFHVETMYVV